MLAITTVVLNITSYYEVIALKKLPNSLTTSMDLPLIHPKVMGWGSPSVITIVVLVSIISGILAYKKCTCCHNMQEKFDDKLKHGKSLISNSFTTCHDENEMNSLLRPRGVPDISTPRLDRVLVQGLGDDGISITVDEVDGEIRIGYGDSHEEVDLYSIDDEVFTGSGDNQLVEDQYSIDDELLLGCGDKGLFSGLVKINSVLKLSDVPPI